MKRCETWLALLGLVLLFGCDSTSTNLAQSSTSEPAETQTAQDTSTTQPNTDAGDSQTDSQPQLTAALASWEEVQQEVARHQGKVVVLDIWSTSCEPCMRELPHLADLQQTHGDKLVAIALNIDYTGLPKHPPESLQPKVEKFINMKQVDIVNYVSTTPDQDVMKEAGVYSIPVVKVYDTDGQLHEQFDDSKEYPDAEEGFTYAQHITPVVDRLLGP